MAATTEATTERESSSPFFTETGHSLEEEPQAASSDSRILEQSLVISTSLQHKNGLQSDDNLAEILRIIDSAIEIVLSDDEDDLQSIDE